MKIFFRRRLLGNLGWIACIGVAVGVVCSLIETRPLASQSTITGVARFKDGDSGFVGDTEIRLRCIDTADYGTVAGRRAAQFAWREIDEQHLTCTRRQSKLSYGRVVVSCVFDTGRYRGRNVNRLLVDTRHARYVSALCAAEALSW